MINHTIKKIKSKIRKIFSFNDFKGSEKYWKDRYKKGGTSGSGSYGYLAEFKAEFLNNFISDNKVQSVIEFGCGDGNQLKLSKYPSYIGFDISQESINRCTDLFINDKSKKFMLVTEYTNELADLTLSLDVIFHLTEDHVYQAYMNKVFNSATRYVIIYSSNTEHPLVANQRPHVRHRMFTQWVEKNIPRWKLIQHVPNKYPFDGTEKTSFSDFYVFELENPIELL
jgi:SAM-dependent methyltransferase